MTRVCLIGDSHLAALHLGWKTLAAEFPNVEATFLASPSKSMQHLAVADGTLVPGSEELAHHFARTAHVPAIDGTYDLYVVYCLQCSVRHCIGVRKAFRERKTTGNLEGAVPDLIGATVGGRTLRLMREITNKPTVLMPGPMIAERLCADMWAELRRSGDDARLAAFFHRSCREFAESAGAQFLPQPAETLASPLHTRDEYAAGQARFSKSGKTFEGDGVHMNPAYGAAIMRQLMAVIAV